MTNTTTPTHADERRRARRVRAPSNTRLRLSGLLDQAVVEDISSSGICCATSQPIPVLSQVQMVLILRIDGVEREVVCAGAVVRSARRRRTVPGGAAGDHAQHGRGKVGAHVASSQHGAPPAGSDGSDHETAIFFTEISDADRTALDEYVSSLHRASAVA